MAIQIGKYKRPGIFIEEIDKTIVTSPIPDTGFANLVVGFSRKGPVNSAILLNTLSDLENTFGSIDRGLERRGSFFHRTITKMLEAGPIYGMNLLLTDDVLDTVEYQSLSATTFKNNDIERTDSFRKFFDTTGFWKRDPEAFIDITRTNPGYNGRVLNLTNLGDKYTTVFVVKSQVSGFNRSMLEWYGSKEKLPPYVYPTDLASDYLVDVVVVGGDWSNYSELSVDPRWTLYFAEDGLKKEQLRAFANDRNVTLLAYYEGVSLIPYFRDLNGRNIFIESIINKDTDKTGLFCAFNNELFETDYPTGLIDLIGNSLISDSLLSNPPSSEETYYASIDANDGVTDGEISVKFLSYDEQITETVLVTNRVLDRPGNVVGLFGTNSAVLSNSGVRSALGAFTHSLNDSTAVTGGVVGGPNDDTNLNYIKWPNRTYYFTEGYVNDLFRVASPSTSTQSITLEYAVDGTSDNGYAVINGSLVTIASGTQSIQILNTEYPQLPTTSGTQSYSVAFVLDTSGTVQAKKSAVSNTRVTVNANDIVLSYGTVSVYGGEIQSTTLVDVTINDTTGGGGLSYIPLTYGTDYTFSTASTLTEVLAEGDILVTFTNTNSTPDVKNYEQYRKFKLFNSMLTYINTSNTFKGLLLIDPSTTTTKKPLSEVSFRSIKTGTTVNKSFVMSTGLTSAEISDIMTNGELIFYKIDDELLIDYAGLRTKNTLPVLDGTVNSYGVVGRYSNYYTYFDQGQLNTGDAFFQNELWEGVQVQFLQGGGVTASLDGYNYIIFKVEEGRTYTAQTKSYLSNFDIGVEGDEFTDPVYGYQFLITGSLNKGAFTAKWDGGLRVENGLTLPSDASGALGGRAFLIATYSNGIIDTIDSASYSYYAYEVKESIVDETINITKMYGYSSNYNGAPIYLQNYVDDTGNLYVEFTQFNLGTQSVLNSENTTPGSALATNGTLFIKSEKGNYKQTLELEYPSGWVPVPNKVLVQKSRYGEVRVGDFLEAEFDETLLRSDEMPKKLTRILTKKLWSNDPNYLEFSTDSAIKVRDFNGNKQTNRFTKIDDYITTYKGIILKGFRIREASLPDGTDSRQNEILTVINKGTTLFKALTNKEAFDFRYLIDSFGLGLTADSKQQLVDICGDRLDAFGIINMPSLKQFKNSSNPSFKDSSGNVQLEFVAAGANPESNPNFLYSFGKGVGVTTVGYFLPYVTIDDQGRTIDVPPSAYVGLTYMRKHKSTTTSVTPWTIAAGVNNGRINGILDLEQIFTPSDLEYLNQAQMNPLTFKRNRGFIIETENTAQVLVKSALSLIHVREVLIELERELSRMLLDFQWTVNSPEIRSQIKLAADVICEKYVAQLGLFNYFNKIDEENNTLELIDNGIGVLDTYVEPIKGMGIIVNNITILRTGAISAGGFINS
jgi:hypothetical protein